MLFNLYFLIAGCLRKFPLIIGLVSTPFFSIFFMNPTLLKFFFPIIGIPNHDGLVNLFSLIIFIKLLIFLFFLNSFKILFLFSDLIFINLSKSLNLLNPIEAQISVDLKLKPYL